MITDNQLYTLAIFLGSAAMLMIVLYHFLEVNSSDNDNTPDQLPPTGAGRALAAGLGGKEKGRGHGREGSWDDGEKSKS